MVDTRSSRNSLRALVIALSLGICASAAAQNTVTPSDDQLRLLEKAVRASDADNLQEALRFYEAALALGEVNLAYMGRGRAYQKAGACANASADYERALAAPAAESPPPDAVRGAIEGYRAELVKVCPGTLRLACDADVEVRVNGRLAPCNKLQTLEPGTYMVVARARGETQEREVSVAALQEAEVEFTFAAPVVAAPVQVEPRIEPPVAAVAPESSETPWVAWSLVGGGAVLMAVGGGFALAVDGTNSEMATLAQAERIDASRASSLRSDANTYATLQFVGLGVGVAAVSLGAVMLLNSAEEPLPTGGVNAWVAPGGGGASWEARW